LYSKDDRQSEIFTTTPKEKQQSTEKTNNKITTTILARPAFGWVSKIAVKNTSPTRTTKPPVFLLVVDPPSPQILHHTNHL
jgi:hypothetical protein